MDLTILTVIALVFFLMISFKRLNFCLGFILIFLPTYLIRFKIGFVPFTFLEMMILIVTAVWLIKILVKKEKVDLGGFFLVSAFFILSALVAALVSPDIESALGIFKAYFLEAILFFIVMVNVVKTRKQMKFIIFSMGVSALFVAIFAVWQYFGIFPGLEPYISENPRRATSLFEFPTAVGKFLGPILSFFLALIFVKLPRDYQRPLSHKIYLWGVALFSVLGILFSVTRGAILGLFIALLFISFFSRHRKKIWTGLIVLLLFFLVLPQGRQEITSIVSGQDTSTDVHMIMWQGTWRLLKDNPITGAGLAGFPQVYNIYRDAAHTELFPYPDNFFLAVWVELGLAGLFVFGWLFYKYIRRSVILLKSKISNFDRQVVVGLLSVFIYMMFHGLVDTPYFKNDLSVMFWAFVGLLVITSRLNFNLTGQKEKNSV
ncbi:MAG: O-antigen ligase family protein [Patescibacteria group bacterium]|nr:O-antigen ligase family protein [Patescibacteria group bacterium]